MLDKSIPYAEFWMYRSRDLPVTELSLPEGFHFDYYQAGDEHDWAAIETAVLEFDNKTEALAYFNKTFFPYPEELKQRMVFVTTNLGEKVGTCSAWWKETAKGDRYPLIHWVAIKPSYQGMGLAKAMVNHVLKILQDLEQSSLIYLHTQTWSYAAIRLYQKLGFDISTKTIDGSPNTDYQKAKAILAELETKRK